MASVKRIRQAGLWIIIGASLMALLALNVCNYADWADTVVTISFVLLVVWLLIMAIAGYVVANQTGKKPKRRP